ncbi:hypothetical protein EJ08DRAFT_649807 [Tothia fuscella]|uniref:DUF6590 domain-containing protein n=1 Tax=Tothia fuscella TaxID=1048955 RepID=A0A9P4NRB8_9PEZI|nr:hypothetical protein EJ08DRAFT_649807 [Tothia fuscella]
MDLMSRLNYDKVYTVEHYVKVCDFGDVHRSCHNLLDSNFFECWKYSKKRTARSEEEEEEEEETQDE